MVLIRLLTLNRTMVELKYLIMSLVENGNNSLNRTMVELKFLSAQGFPFFIQLLIAQWLN